MITLKKSLKIVVYVTTLALTAHCGEATDDGGDTTEEQSPTATNPSSVDTAAVGADTPTDSTGAFGSVDLSFSTLEAATTALALAGTSVDLGTGVVITDARVNIAAIKLKAEKEKSVDEEAFKEELKLKKKVWEQEIETQKQALELEGEEIKNLFGEDKEGLEGTALETREAKMEADVAAVKVRMSALEKGKEDQEAQFEIENDKNIKWGGPFLYDLVSNTMTPPLPEVQVVDGSYKRIEFKVKPNRTLEGTDTLLNNSIVIAGTVDSVAFAVSFPMSEEFRLSGAGAFGVNADGSNDLNIAFSLAKWFDLVDFSAAVAVDGVIAISEDSTEAANKEIWVAIKKNIKMSTKFGKDEDGDGELGEDESEGDGEENIDDLEMEEAEEDEEDEG